MFRNIGIVYRKELLDTIREKRTIISMVVVPILLFPLLTLGLSSFMAGMMEKSKAEKHKIVFVGKETAPQLFAMVNTSLKVEVVEIPNMDSLKESILKKDIMAAIIVPNNFQNKIESLDSTSIQILYNAAETKSEFALSKLKDIVSTYEKEVLDSRLIARGMNPALLKPFTTKEENVASKEKMGGFVLSMFLPYIIVILSMVGAMYTAMDLTAGEKERGTLETILVSPIPRWQLAAGKFLTILTTSILSATFAIISMTLTMAYGFMATSSMGGEMALNITPSMILIIFLMMLPTACLFSALLMSISIFAKSYKEAQSYVSPLMTVVILPSMVTFIPGIDLNFQLAFVPLVNICLSIKEALMGNINWLYIAIIFFSTFIYAGFAIFVTHRMFQKESVLFRS